MQYSPKLKKAMKQIKAVLDEHDIAGSVVLHTPGFGEHFIKLDPSYSAMKIKDEALHIRVKEAEVGKKKAKQLATDTANMANILTTLTGKHAMMLIHAEETLEKNLDIQHGKGGYTSDSTQNN